MDTTTNTSMDRGAAGKPTPRFQRAERRQREWRDFCLDEAVRDDDSVRQVWTYTEALDLSKLYDRIEAVEGHVGRDPIDPKILVALWLFATIEGVGSARRLDKLCKRDICYRWICGGVSVNYHTLADFRVKHLKLLDDLLTQSVAVLLHEGLIELNRVAQDGMRVRASAGSSSFRRRPTLEQCLEEAETQLETLKREAEHDDNSAEDRRVKAARERAARERVERVRKAVDELPGLEEKMEQRKKGTGKNARASTTDPEARRMKMADGGFRPAMNVQFATTTETQVIVGVEVINVSSDAGQMAPMIAQIEERYKTRPEEYLADGGYSTLDDIETVEQAGTKVYVPVKDEEKKREKGDDPFARRRGDSDEVAAWRERMGTEQGRQIYKQRPETAEFPNAGCRNRGLWQFLVRSVRKTKAVSLWHVLAHNFHRTLALRAAADVAMC